MTVKHTPGPWFTSPEGQRLICSGEQRTALMGDFRGSHVAEVLCNALAVREQDDTGAADRAEVSANANLIAAAPVLADAADIVARHDVTAAIAFLLANSESPPGCDGDAPERAYTLEHSYEDDARYTYPARAKLWSAVLSVALRAAGRLP